MGASRIKILGEGEACKKIKLKINVICFIQKKNVIFSLILIS